jgi:hypothetical protein
MDFLLGYHIPQQPTVLVDNPIPQPGWVSYLGSATASESGATVSDSESDDSESDDSEESNDSE